MVVGLGTATAIAATSAETAATATATVGGRRMILMAVGLVMMMVKGHLEASSGRKV